MSQSSSGATTEDLSVTSTPNREPMLAGFPWVSAIILYTLSWGWSLLRPNTLYWDDWHDLFQRDKWFARDYYLSTGRPPWEGVSHAFLTPVGIWTFTYLTLVLFFVSGLLLYLILRPTRFFIDQDLKFVVLIFMIVPVNHARISAVIFQYTTSYLLFFLGWFLLVRYKSTNSFVLACLILFLSFKTHSFLFFVLLPFLHFCWLNKMQLGHITTLHKRHAQLVAIALLPISYLPLRDLFWPPSEEWASYQRPGMAGLVRWLPFSIPFLLGLLLFSWSPKFKKDITRGFFYLWIGSGITALALLPYFLIGYFRPYASLIAFRADWGTRHQLLMPLGLALSVVGLNELFNWRKKNIVFVATIVLSVTLNMFWGSQYFLMSHKQEQLVELFTTTKNKIEIASVEDQAMQFNGRGSSFRSYEWNGFMTLAEISTDRPGCESLPSGAALILKSSTSYLKALVTRDLDLYFEVKPCSEVLAENG